MRRTAHDAPWCEACAGRACAEGRKVDGPSRGARVAEQASAHTRGSASLTYDAYAAPIHRRWPWRNFEAVEYATFEWVDWFSDRRAEEQYYAAAENIDIAA